MRRDFTPYSEDLEFLNKRGAPWEAVKEGNRTWYVLHDYTPPKGYSPASVSVAFMLQGSYPSTQIDMAYFYPALQRMDGKAPAALANHNFDGKVWQRWSRHRNSPSDWKDGVDFLGSHLTYIEGILAFEVQGKYHDIQT